MYNKQMMQLLLMLLALMVSAACSSTEPAEDPDFSMRYEICKPAYAGPLECPDAYALEGEN